MGKEKQKSIPYFAEINDFLEATQVKDRSNNPLFYCMRLKEHEEVIYMPPFRRGFYFVGLLTTKSNAEVAYNDKKISILDSFIVFQSPNLLYSFYREPDTIGYLIYFKEDCLNFFKPNIQEEFPFFNVLNTTLFQLNKQQFEYLSSHFEYLFQSFEKEDIRVYNKGNAFKLLILLNELLNFPPISESLIPDRQVRNKLVSQFIQLVNVHYLEVKMISEYADMLSVSEDHLSKSVKSETGKTAYSYIIERMIKEAKDLIAYTDLTCSEIAYQLNFSDTSNFSKYFKRAAKLSPTEYRKSHRTR